MHTLCAVVRINCHKHTHRNWFWCFYLKQGHATTASHLKFIYHIIIIIYISILLGELRNFLVWTNLLWLTRCVLSQSGAEQKQTTRAIVQNPADTCWMKHKHSQSPWHTHTHRQAHAQHTQHSPGATVWREFTNFVVAGTHLCTLFIQFIFNDAKTFIVSNGSHVCWIFFFCCSPMQRDPINVATHTDTDTTHTANGLLAWRGLFYSICLVRFWANLY